ncbi:hypothetical protein D9M72_572290 [compost metagenome]
MPIAPSRFACASTAAVKFAPDTLAFPKSTLSSHAPAKLTSRRSNPEKSAPVKSMPPKNRSPPASACFMPSFNVWACAACIAGAGCCACAPCR